MGRELIPELAALHAGDLPDNRRRGRRLDLFLLVVPGDPDHAYALELYDNGASIDQLSGSSTYRVPMVYNQHQAAEWIRRKLEAERPAAPDLVPAT